MKLAILLISLVVGVGRANSQAVPFELHREYLVLVDCSVGEINGLSAVIDTGASDTVLDSRLVQRLGLTAATDVATFVNQRLVVGSVEAPSVSLGPLRLGRRPVLAADLSGFAAQAGTRIDVIIGMDLLRGQDFLIDYQSRRLRFGRVTALRHQAAMELRAGVAMVEASSSGGTLCLLVDTGFPQLLLFKGRLALSGGVHEASVTLTTMAASDRLEEVDGASIQVGDWQARHQKLLIAGGKEQQPFDGLLGPRFLGARRIAFDFGKQQFSWE